MHGRIGTADSERLLNEIQSEYAAYDHARREALGPDVRDEVSLAWVPGAPRLLRD